MKTKQDQGIEKLSAIFSTLPPVSDLYESKFWRHKIYFLPTKVSPKHRVGRPVFIWHGQLLGFCILCDSIHWISAHICNFFIFISHFMIIQARNFGEHVAARFHRHAVCSFCAATQMDRILLFSKLYLEHLPFLYFFIFIKPTHIK